LQTKLAISANMVDHFVDGLIHSGLAKMKDNTLKINHLNELLKLVVYLDLTWAPGMSLNTILNAENLELSIQETNIVSSFSVNIEKQESIVF